MCRSQKECKELGTNVENWSTHSPLIPPQWFKDQIISFADAMEMASKGNIPEALSILSEIKSDELRDWYCEHGQVSGRFRNKILNIPRENKLDELDPIHSPDKHAKEVFERDHFTCQYCGMKVIPKEVFWKFQKMVGKQNFCATGTNQARHGAVLAFRANADHVIPWNIGGKTNPENLITCCWSCNYGKAGFTLEQLQLDNPKQNKFTNANWRGLIEFL